jgi:hypothetical protein
MKAALLNTPHMPKYEIPIIKSQITNKFQLSMTKSCLFKGLLL